MNEHLGKNILIVEDDLILARLYGKKLEAFGYKVNITNTGEDAVKLFKENKDIDTDLILMDVSLGEGIDGIEAAALIMSVHEVPVVFLSNHTEREIVEKTEKINSYGYVVKGADNTVLDASIKTALKLFESKKMVIEKEKELRLIEKRYREELESRLKEKTVELETEKNGRRLAEEALCENVIRRGFIADNSTDGRLKADTAAGRDFEEKYRLAMEAVNEGLWDWNLATGEVYYSPAYYKILGYDGSGAVKTAEFWKELIHPDDSEKVLSKNADCIEGRCEEFSVEFRMKASSGEWRWIMGRGRSVARDAKGRSTRMIGTHTDITARKKVYEELRRSRELFESVVQNSSGLTMLTDETGKIVFLSRQCEKILGHPPEKFIGCVMPDIIHPDDIAACRNALEGVLFHGKKVVDFEYRIIDGAGNTRWIIHSADSLKIDGVFIGVQSTIYDITDRKRSQESLQARKSYLSAIIENQPGILWLKDIDGRFLKVNREFARSCGFDDPEMLVGKSDFDIWPAELAAKYVADDRKVIGSKISYTVEEPIFINNEKKWFETFKTPVFGTDGNVIGTTGYSREITGRKLAEEAIKLNLKQKSALLEASKFVLNVEEFDKAARHVFDACRAVIGATAGYVALLSEDGTENKVLFLEAGGRECAVDPSLPMPLRGLRAEAYRTGRAVYNNNFDSSEWVKFIPARHVKLDNVMFAPLNINEKTVGIIGLANKPGPFDGKDAFIAEAFGSIAAFSLKNSRTLELLRKSNDEKQSLIREKEMILKEVHHRIKNNMNVVASIMYIQMESLKDQAAIEALKDAVSRVQSMMVLYDKIYRSNSDFKNLSFREYLSPLVDEIIGNFPNNKIVEVVKEIDDLTLDTKIISIVGIIINEILTNIMKYAFKGREKGTIIISARANEGRMKIVVEDDGVGIPEFLDAGGSGGFGLELVEMMTGSLRGTMRIDREKGTKFTLEFKL